MKKYITATLFIFFAITLAVLTAGMLSKNNISQQLSGLPTPDVSDGKTVSGVSGVTSSKNSISLTKVELAKHNSAQSCWLLISGKIYDVSRFLNMHPGDSSSIIPTCGTDATVAYDVQGPASKAHTHSSNATSMLADYFIGNLNQNISTGTAGSSTATTSNTSSTSNTNPKPVVTTPKPPVVSTTTLTMSELAKHSSSQSCWLLISGDIYDVTSFLNLHPGQASSILPTCGTDATVAYNTQGPASGPHAHSSNARAMLGNYFIGNLNQNVNTPAPGTNPTTSPTQPRPRGGDEFDD
ncbi:MAG: cytochrome b5 domain-containing protein [bacterium]